MRGRNTITTVVSVVLVAALAFPGAALALERTAPVDREEVAATVDGDRLQELRDRIAEILRIRKARFDAAYERIGARIERIGDLADRVEDAGGDVSRVRTRLEQAATALEAAKTTELHAAELFRAIPDATDKRAAFARATAAGREAVLKLERARVLTRDAAQELGAIVRQMKENAGA